MGLCASIHLIKLLKGSCWFKDQNTLKGGKNQQQLEQVKNLIYFSPLMLIDYISTSLGWENEYWADYSSFDACQFLSRITSKH